MSKEYQEAFWGRLFSTPSTPDSRPVVPVRDPQWAMLDPITVEEVGDCLRDMKGNSAAGPGQLTVQQLELTTVDPRTDAQPLALCLHLVQHLLWGKIPLQGLEDHLFGPWY